MTEQTTVDYAKTKRTGNLILAGALGILVLALMVSAYWLR